MGTYSRERERKRERGRERYAGNLGVPKIVGIVDWIKSLRMT